jgi:hypothetical protein
LNNYCFCPFIENKKERTEEDLMADAIVYATALEKKLQSCHQYIHFKVLERVVLFILKVATNYSKFTGMV